MRILHVSPTYFPAVRYGGPIRSVHGLAAALAARGHDVWVCTTNVDGDGRLDVPIGTPVEIDGVKVLYFDVPYLARLYLSPALGSWLKRHVAGFDVVHTHSIYLWPNVAATWSARGAGVPYVVSPRGMLVAELIRRKSRLVKTAWINLIERRELAGAAFLHATSGTEIHEAAQLHLPLPRFVEIPNGVGVPPAVERARRFETLPARYALFLGRLNWKKGLDRLLAAWPAVDGLDLVVAGNDEEAYVPVLRELAARLGVTDRIRFIGAVGDADKWALYRDAQVFLLPSYSENFANTVLEAMAMGCPVVVTPEVGLADVVRETGSGLVVPGTPEAIAEAVNSLVRDEAGRVRMGGSGQVAAQARFTWGQVAQRMEAAYRDAVGATPQRRSAA